MNKNITRLMATASLGLLAFGTAACGGDDGEKTAPPSASGSPSAPASPGQGAATPGAPSGAPAAPGAPGGTAAPGGAPAPPPPPPALQVVMIDPKGTKYGRQSLADSIAQGIRATGAKVSPSHCENAYQKTLQQGAKFPAGKQAYIQACQQGVRQASGG
ncbi:hypothetical protein ACQP1W_11115 [Spirillospora sp. CA-255316]